MATKYRILEQEEEEFLRKFSLRKFYVPADRLSNCSTYSNQSKNDVSGNLPQKNYHIEYKDLKRALKLNVPWWLRTDQIVEDIYTERLVALVEEPVQKTFSSKCIFTVFKEKQISQSYEKLVHLSQAFGGENMEGFSNLQGKSIVNTCKHEQFIDEIFNVSWEGKNQSIERCLNRVLRTLNNLENIRLGSGCEKCRGKAVCDGEIDTEKNSGGSNLQNIDKEIGNICYCLENLMAEQCRCNDPSLYMTIIRRLQKIRKSLTEVNGNAIVRDEDFSRESPQEILKKVEKFLDPDTIRKINENSKAKSKKNLQAKADIGTYQNRKEIRTNAAPQYNESNRKRNDPKRESAVRPERMRISGAEQTNCKCCNCNEKSRRNVGNRNHVLENGTSTPASNSDNGKYQRKYNEEHLAANRKKRRSLEDERLLQKNNYPQEKGKVFENKNAIQTCRCDEKSCPSRVRNKYDNPHLNIKAENTRAGDDILQYKQRQNSVTATAYNNANKAQSNLEKHRRHSNPIAENPKLPKHDQKVCRCCENLKNRNRQALPIENVRPTKVEKYQRGYNKTELKGKDLQANADKAVEQEKDTKLLYKNRYQPIKNEKPLNAKDNYYNPHSKVKVEHLEPVADTHAHQDADDISRYNERRNYVENPKQQHKNCKHCDCIQKAENLKKRNHTAKYDEERSTMNKHRRNSLEDEPVMAKADMTAYQDRNDLQYSSHHNKHIERDKNSLKKHKDQADSIGSAVKCEQYQRKYNEEKHSLDKQKPQPFENEAISQNIVEIEYKYEAPLKNQITNISKLNGDSSVQTNHDRKDKATMFCNCEGKIHKLRTRDNHCSFHLSISAEYDGELSNAQYGRPGDEGVKGAIQRNNKSQDLINAAENCKTDETQIDCKTEKNGTSLISDGTHPQTFLASGLLSSPLEKKIFASNNEEGITNQALATKFCYDCFGENVPVIKDNLAAEIRKIIGNRKPNSVFVRFTVGANNLYHMQMSTDSEFLGCLYATKSATLKARNCNGFDGYITLCVTDTSNTLLQIQNLVDHAFVVVHQENATEIVNNMQLQ